jgi:bacteriocin-like protein
MNSFEVVNAEELKAVEGGGSSFFGLRPIVSTKLVELALKGGEALVAPLKLVQQYIK